MQLADGERDQRTSAEREQLLKTYAAPAVLLLRRTTEKEGKKLDDVLKGSDFTLLRQRVEVQALRQ
jgi:hypothetical protein